MNGPSNISGKIVMISIRIVFKEINDAKLHFLHEHCLSSSLKPDYESGMPFVGLIIKEKPDFYFLIYNVRRPE